MPSWNCNKKLSSGKTCDGAMVLIDGDKSHARLRCSKCSPATVIILPEPYANVKKRLAAGGPMRPPRKRRGTI